MHNFLASASSIIDKGANSACSDKACNTATNLQGIFGTITSTLIYLVGALSVIMLIVGGLRYVTSAGDSKRVTDAKNTITYSIVGVIVSLLAYAIIKFVTGAIG